MDNDPLLLPFDPVALLEAHAAPVVELMADPSRYTDEDGQRALDAINAMSEEAGRARRVEVVTVESAFEHLTMLAALLTSAEMLRAQRKRKQAARFDQMAQRLVGFLSHDLAIIGLGLEGLRTVRTGKATVQ